MWHLKKTNNSYVYRLIQVLRTVGMKKLRKTKQIIIKFFRDRFDFLILRALHWMLDQWQVLWFSEAQVLRSNPGKGPSVSAQTEPVSGRKESISVFPFIFFLKKRFSFEQSAIDFSAKI
jgi:hypothetical protein